jgi:uncharacterized protein
MFIFSACHSKQNILLEQYPNGDIKKGRDYTNDSVYYEREYYESGDLSVIKKFKNGLQDSVQTAYDKSGNVKSQVSFKKGLRNGILLENYDYGTTAFEGNCVDGKFEGKAVYYYSNGKKQREGFRHLDIDTGTWLFYDTAGKLVNQVVK